MRIGFEAVVNSLLEVDGLQTVLALMHKTVFLTEGRSEERRVGKECRSRWSPDH